MILKRRDFITLLGVSAARRRHLRFSPKSVRSARLTRLRKSDYAGN
jgi:hypothetical protein